MLESYDDRNFFSIHKNIIHKKFVKDVEIQKLD